MNENEEKYGVIYMLFNNINDKAYIGQAIDFDNRMGGHVRDSKRNHKTKCLIDKKIREYGWDNFDKLIIATAYNKQHMDKLEDYYIDYYKTLVTFGQGYNVRKGGSRGRQSEASRQKISIAQTGDKNHNFGKSPSEETRKKQSKAMKGKTVSEETRNKISKTLTGRTRPEEAKKNIHEALKKIMMPCQLVDTGECFESAREAGIKMNLPQGNISAQLRGKRNRVGGLTFKRISKEEFDIYTLSLKKENK